MGFTNEDGAILWCQIKIRSYKSEYLNLRECKQLNKGSDPGTWSICRTQAAALSCLKGEQSLRLVALSTAHATAHSSVHGDPHGSSRVGVSYTHLIFELKIGARGS